MHLTAEQLATEYVTDPDGFKKKYLEKSLLITGEVVSFRFVDIASFLQLVELKGNEFLKVRCYTPLASGWLLPVSYQRAGTKVRFIGSISTLNERGVVRVDINIPLTDN